jgi:hypothetical protein
MHQEEETLGKKVKKLLTNALAYCRWCRYVGGESKRVENDSKIKIGIKTGAKSLHQPNISSTSHFTNWSFHQLFISSLGHFMSWSFC